jgi:hypothetical protein
VVGEGVNPTNESNMADLISPAMLDAGVKVLEANFCLIDDRYMVQRIYQAMRAAEPPQPRQIPFDAYGEYHEAWPPNDQDGPPDQLTYCNGP